MRFIWLYRICLYIIWAWPDCLRTRQSAAIKSFPFNLLTIHIDSLAEVMVTKACHQHETRFVRYRKSVTLRVLRVDTWTSLWVDPWKPIIVSNQYAQRMTGKIPDLCHISIIMDFHIVLAVPEWDWDCKWSGALFQVNNLNLVSYILMVLLGAQQ